MFKTKPVVAAYKEVYKFIAQSKNWENIDKKTINLLNIVQAQKAGKLEFVKKSMAVVIIILLYQKKT